MTSIKLPTPEWNSELTETILELEQLRTKELYGKVPPYIFFQLKTIFQMLETLGSARIEGNQTTIGEYVEQKIESDEPENQREIELANIEKATRYIEEHVNAETYIGSSFISELHNIITANLLPPSQNGEGSDSPGEIRNHDVVIKKSKHKPIDFSLVQAFYSDFIEFINVDYHSQNQLLMVAIAHHWFTHIHPFDNGNGRLVRLITYALLIKFGFSVNKGRIINPSHIFYSNRDKYYQELSKADSLTDPDLLEWSHYFLTGLKNEITKIDSLMDMNYVRNEILLPTINLALKRKYFTKNDYAILNLLISKDDISIKSEHLDALGYKTSSEKTRAMKSLRKAEIVTPSTEGGRIYQLNFTNNHLLRCIVQILEEKGFVADFLTT